MCCNLVTLGSLIVGSAVSYVITKRLTGFHMEIRSKATALDITMSKSVEDNESTLGSLWQNFSLVLNHRKSQDALNPSRKAPHPGRDFLVNRAKKVKNLKEIIFVVSSSAFYSSNVLIQIIL